MATTGFWPVKGSLKTVIDYADNPDKTTERKYLDDDLAQALEYVANDDKTDRKMYVSGVNCTKDRAYEEMMAIQRRFGLRGTNVAYHGFQSFKPGEVSPEKAHQIGIETARRMWGDMYQVVVTTHLNTDSVHNHIVVHAVSFKDGKKFQNHVRDHIRLREISDQICREHRLSVLEDAPFFGKGKGVYWAHKAGKLTHRDQLRNAVEHSLYYAVTTDEFFDQLEGLGYEIDYDRLSVKAPAWERSIRLDRLGYPMETIYRRLTQSFYRPGSVAEINENPPYRPAAAGTAAGVHGGAFPQRRCCNGGPAVPDPDPAFEADRRRLVLGGTMSATLPRGANRTGTAGPVHRYDRPDGGERHSHRH